MSVNNGLVKALKEIDEKGLKAEFFANHALIEKIEACCARLALWSNEIRRIEDCNAAPFLLEMQRSSHDVAVLLSLALYIPAAASMRTTFETCLYYSYFRSHPAELVTLVANSDFFISKSEIIEYHKLHSPWFRKNERLLGLVSRLSIWYSEISAIVHGQMPGKWGSRLSLASIRHNEKALKEAVVLFEGGTKIINDLLLLTVGCELWNEFHFSAKAIILKGVSAEHRNALDLDGK